MTGCSINEVMWYKSESSGMSKTRKEGAGMWVWRLIFCITYNSLCQPSTSASSHSSPCVPFPCFPDVLSSMFTFTMVRWFLASDRKNKIANASGWEFVDSVCMTVLRDLVIHKAPRVIAVSLYQEESATVVYVAHKDLKQRWESGMRNIVVSSLLSFIFLIWMPGCLNTLVTCVYILYVKGFFYFTSN